MDIKFYWGDLDALDPSIHHGIYLSTISRQLGCDIIKVDLVKLQKIAKSEDEIIPHFIRVISHETIHSALQHLGEEDAYWDYDNVFVENEMIPLSIQA